MLGQGTDINPRLDKQEFKPPTVRDGLKFQAGIRQVTPKDAQEVVDSFVFSQCAVPCTENYVTENYQTPVLKIDGLRRRIYT